MHVDFSINKLLYNLVNIVQSTVLHIKHYLAHVYCRALTILLTHLAGTEMFLLSLPRQLHQNQTIHNISS